MAMKEISVAEYASNPKYHKTGTPVPKPTVFKQIHEDRLPPGVSARQVGRCYIITVLEKDQVFDLVGKDPATKEQTVLISGEEKYIKDLAKKLNKYYKSAPVKAVPHKTE